MLSNAKNEIMIELSKIVSRNKTDDIKYRLHNKAFKK